MGASSSATLRLMRRQRLMSSILISSGFYVRGVPGFLRYLFFPLDRIMARQFYKRSVRAASLTARAQGWAWVVRKQNLAGAAA